MNGVINLYDTSTLPTPAMREAMYHAVLGDDVYGEDPTVNELEAEAARLVGKDAALFVASGTMGNLIAMMSQTQRGDEVILEADSHIFYYEAGGLAAVAGLMPHTVVGDRGVLDADRVRHVLRRSDIHYPTTKLVCIENTHNRAGGTVTRPEIIRGLRSLCDEHGLSLHMDGARVFNAAVALGVPVTELTGPVHTVQFCLSKGLSAPVGSILAGPSAVIRRARHIRKMLGGGMRQAGVLAAAGLVALREGVDRLAEDHATARLLAQRLAGIPGIHIDMDQVQTNMVMLQLAESGITASDLSARLKANGIRVSARPPFTVRMVTHRSIGPAEVDAVVETVAAIMRGQAASRL